MTDKKNGCDGGAMVTDTKAGNLPTTDELLAQYGPSSLLDSVESFIREVRAMCLAIPPEMVSVHIDPEMYLLNTQAIRAAIEQRDQRVAELDEWKRRAEMLWQLLDNIDTAADMAKGDFRWYFGTAMKQAQKRFALADSDGYSLTWKPPAALEAAATTPDAEAK